MRGRRQAYTARAWRRRSAGTFAVIGLIVVLVALFPIVVLWLNNDVPKAAVVKSVDRPRTVIVLEPKEGPASNEVRQRKCHPWGYCRNGQDNVDIAVLRNGTMPTSRIKAVVETDNDCTPDDRGISHCANKLRLASGEMIEVQHDHDMNAYPCLKPGERVEVKPQSSI